MDLDILFEDHAILVINKPAGISVHAGSGRREPTLVQGLIHYTKELSRSTVAEGHPFRPGIVHRLDRDTTGVMVIAKNDLVHDRLAKQFARKENRRQYLALLNGRLPKPEVWVENYLFRDPHDRRKFKHIGLSEYEQAVAQRLLPGGKYRWSKSFFKLEKEFSHHLSLVSVRLFTGRTHQIRVHALGLQTPIVGDALYNASQQNRDMPSLQKIQRQMLHAWLLEFNHPITGKIVQYTAPLPDDFKNLLKDLKAISQ